MVEPFEPIFHTLYKLEAPWFCQRRFCQKFAGNPFCFYVVKIQNSNCLLHQGAQTAVVSQQSYVSIAPGQSINVYSYGGTTTTPVASSVNPNSSGPNPNVPPPVAVNSSGGPSTMVSGTPTAAGSYSYSLPQHQVRQTIIYLKFLYHDYLF